MRIDSPTPVIEPTPRASSDGVAIQAENRNIIRAVHAINASNALPTNNELVFSLDRRSRRPVIKVVNRLTREVLQQIPNEQVLRLAADLRISGRGR